MLNQHGNKLTEVLYEANALFKEGMCNDAMATHLSGLCLVMT